MVFPSKEEQMSTRAGNIVNSKKAPLHLQNGKKTELQAGKSRPADKSMVNRRRLARERKLALLQDVDDLKKKLRHEEYVHKALERAFTRPLRALPRLPPYLPQYTVELLAEVAVLEEEVVQLEEQAANFRRALCISSRRSRDNSSSDSLIRSCEKMLSRSLSQSEVNLGSWGARLSPPLSRRFLFSDTVPNGQTHCQERLKNGEQSGTIVESEANKISEDLLKCLVRIFLRLSAPRGKTLDVVSFSSLAARVFNDNNIESDIRDPYFNVFELKKRDIGAYARFYAIEAGSFDLNRKRNASFLISRLKLLLDNLTSVKLDGLNHQHKLAFWINIYNSCIMNAVLEHGIPECPDKIVKLMQKATIKVGGHILSALMVEHFILRLPYHLKYVRLGCAESDEMKACRRFGLEWSEPLVTFALSSGSWSSPAVRVYTASQVGVELEAAKKEYLQAAVGISSRNKLIIPKLLDWYLLDFAKDLDALLEWICLQLPDQFRNQLAQTKETQPLSNLVQVMPFNFSFRYLIHQ